MLRQKVLTANELLRHMWACFPLVSQQRVAKAQRLAAALSAQYQGCGSSRLQYMLVCIFPAHEGWP